VMEYAASSSDCVEAGLMAKSLKSLDTKSNEISDLALLLAHCIH
jgi:hypothetical protein